MRPFPAIALAGALLSACVVYEPYQPVATHAERARARTISEREAIRAAEEICRERGLEVNRVYHAELDPEGRWRIELRGPTGDRAKLLLDARTGRLLRGRFRDGDGAAAPPDQATPPDQAPAPDPSAPPPPPPTDP